MDFVGNYVVKEGFFQKGKIRLEAMVFHEENNVANGFSVVLAFDSGIDDVFCDFESFAEADAMYESIVK
ncbi:hypothetical protein REJ49_005000 [Citrobacter farmeri]|nr:hypothetical protein [Citrobacter farmeri]